MMNYTIDDFSVGDEVTIREDVADLREYRGDVFRVQAVMPASIYPLRLEGVDSGGRFRSANHYLPVEVCEVEPFLVSMEND
jgi:hypothetical protein